MSMFITKPKKYLTRHYACYYCSCTGFIPIKQLFFRLFSWEIKFKKKKTCFACSGKGFVNSYQVYGVENKYRSYLEH